MNCHDTLELLSGWVDEALTAEERGHVDAHLVECADCRRELERFKETIALLYRAERPRAPMGFVDRVLAAARPVPWYRRFLQRLFLPLSVKLPAEAAALLLVAGLAVYVFQRTPELQQAARQEARQPAARPEAPPALTSAPTPAPVVGEEPSRTLGDRPSQQFQAKRKAPAAPEDTRLSASEEASKAAPEPAPPAPAVLPPPRVEPSVELKKEREGQRLAMPRAPAPPASQSRPAPAEEAGKPAPPPAPPARAAGAVPDLEPGMDVDKEAKAQELGAARAPAPATPQPHPAPATEGRADSERDKTMRSPAPMAPAPRSAVRVLPSADVVGRLAVKDRDAAERALGEVLARAGGVVISRREEAGTTVVEVAVPKAAYPEFSQGLARIGSWRPDGEPSELPPHVRVTLRLVE